MPSHHVSGRKLSRYKDQRKALLRGLTSDLIRHERIVTTLAKAKETAKRTKRRRIGRSGTPLQTTRTTMTISYCPPGIPLERLGLSPRTLSSLKRAYITQVGEVLQMSDTE